MGPRTAEQLARLGLRRIGDVARADRGMLERALGAGGPWLHDLANGIDERPVEPDREAKSVGAEETFEEDLRDPEDLLPFLHEQALRVASRMRGAGLAAGTVSLKLKYADFQLATRQETLPRRTDDGEELYRVATRLLAKADPGRPIRLTGVSASDPGAPEPQLGLFDAQAARRTRLNRSLDQIAGRFGEGAVVPADLLGLKK
ncbi:MAG: hypothetical protein NVS4B10_03250 [Myxococcales bacterium]